jgi:hypothetical protein
VQVTGNFEIDGEQLGLVINQLSQFTSTQLELTLIPAQYGVNLLNVHVQHCWHGFDYQAYLFVRKLFRPQVFQANLQVFQLLFENKWIVLDEWTILVRFDTIVVQEDQIGRNVLVKIRTQKKLADVPVHIPLLDIYTHLNELFQDFIESLITIKICVKISHKNDGNIFFFVVLN